MRALAVVCVCSSVLLCNDKSTWFHAAGTVCNASQHKHPSTPATPALTATQSIKSNRWRYAAVLLQLLCSPDGERATHLFQLGPWK